MIVTDIPTAVSASEQEQLQILAAGGLVLELGAHYGGSTVALAQTARMVHSVDWHMGDASAGFGDSTHRFFVNLERRQAREKVVAHVGRFEDVLPLFKSHTFDLAFIDGHHTYDACTQDAELCRRLVRAGGVIAFHDYGSGFAEVAEAVDRFAAQVNADVLTVNTLAWVVL